MARAKEVSEKTLELNVCAEVLNFIRGWPGCADAFWIGMKQFEEARTGTDEALGNIPDGLHLALQFKAPWASRPDIAPYKYSINWLQQDKLMDLAGTGGAVYYVFPNYNTMRRLVADSPVLAAHTYVTPVVEAGRLSSGRHRAECFESPARVDFYSQRMEAKTKTLKEAFADPPNLTTLAQGHLDRLISTQELRRWLREVLPDPEDSGWRIGQRLRGFSTVWMPNHAAS